MRSGIRSRSSGPHPRLLRTGLALLLTTAVPAQALALTGSGAAPGPIKAGPSRPAAVSVFGDSGASVKEKVQSSLLDAFQESDKVRYLVKLRTQADVAEAAESAREAATPASAELAARSAVINSLKEAAEATQAGLVGFLEKARSAGVVEDFQPFWITNMVAVTSDQSTLEKIAARSDVEAIYEDSKIFLIESDLALEAEAQTEAETEADAGALEGQPEWNVERVGAPAVWRQFGINGTGIVVASMDTGVDPDHPALRNQYRGNGAADHTYTWFDAVSGRSEPYDDNGHGSHTVGTMVGRDESGDNQIGVAPGAQWIAAKMLDANGSGYASWILAAGQWLLEPGGDPSRAPDVVNNSWGGGPGLDEWFRPVVQAWREAGIVPVFANGNDGPGEGTVAEPANYPESIGVGNTTREDDLSNSSGRGPSPYGEIKPELSAPGSGVRSSLPGGIYGVGSGTSMAAPHVAGVAALLRSVDASLSVDEIEEILTRSADPMTNAQYPDVPNNGYGHGIVNAYRAVADLLDLAEGRVSGRLLTEGDDFEPPVITHTPVTESFKNTPTTIIADVADDVSLTAVYLRFRQPGLSWWGIVDMEQVSGDHTGGTFVGTIPAELSTTDTMEYYIEAVDFGNNHAYSGSRTSPHVITMLDGLTPGYLQDFEGSAPGWSMAGTPADLWQIGEPTSGPGAAYSGTRVAATNLAGNYPNNAQSFLISPPIDLSGGPAALRFHHWYDLETNWDYGIVAATTNYGETWDILAQYTGSSGAYREAVVDLSAYAGQPSLYLAFVLDSDSSNVRAGWYVDDVELYVDTEAPAAPTNLAAQPTATGAISLTWDAATAGDFAGYTVYRSTTSGEGYSAIGTASGPSYLDAGVTAGTQYFYVVTASDFFGNESGYSNEAAATAANVAIRFFDDMEAGPGAWTLDGTNNSWEWGVPTSGPGHAFSGANLWATSLSGNYPANANASLVSPPIDLSGLSAANLQFTHWYRLERNFDYGRVEISADGGATWTQLARYTSPGTGGAPVGPESPLIDLTAYVGQTVQIRFRHTSDGSVQYPGWYVDDVIVAGVEAGASQVDLSLSVASEETALKDGQKPEEPVSVEYRMPKASVSAYRIEEEGPAEVGIMSLPVEGTVTVLESGRVVRTNPADGSYSLALPAGDYTLRAESYGYYPQERSASVVGGEETTVNFRLEEIPRGELTGTVTNARTGEPVEGARVRVVEDPRIAPTTTDADGEFRLELLEGTYTVVVTHRDFYGETVEVEVPGDDTTHIEVALRPFVGVPGELAYDDGTAENAWAFYDAGNGWGVRMTTEPGRTVLLTGAKVYLWDASWPGQGADDFSVAVYSARADGSPGDLLAGPVLVENGTLGGWNEVDLREYGLAVQGDFYVAMIQVDNHPNVPGMGFDETTDQGRTWQFVDGAWGPWTEGGNAMIRALVSTEVGAPIITAPADNTFTNQTGVLVEGRGVRGTTIAIHDNGEPVAQATPGEDGTFEAALTLGEGEHVLTATASTADGATTDPSAPVHVTVDLTAPELTVTAPEEGATQNHRLLTVTGQALDAYLAGVTVNGTAADVAEDGQFVAEIIVAEGENLVTIIAADRAGNETAATRTMVVDSVRPELTNLQPESDQSLTTGDSLAVSFDSEPGLALAAFKIVADLGGGESAQDDGTPGLEPGEVGMTEVAPGHYEATFTVPEGMSLPQAYVQFRAMDAAGNTVRATAPGKLTITAEGEDPGDPGDPGEPTGPVAIINGPDTVRRNRWAQFDALQSTSDSEIVSYVWDMGDGSEPLTEASIRYRWRRPGTYTVTLTVTDQEGDTATATVTVEVTR